MKILDIFPSYLLPHIDHVLGYKGYHSLGFFFFEYSYPEILSIVDAVRGR